MNDVLYCNGKQYLRYATLVVVLALEGCGRDNSASSTTTTERGNSVLVRLKEGSEFASIWDYDSDGKADAIIIHDAVVYNECKEAYTAEGYARQVGTTIGGTFPLSDDLRTRASVCLNDVLELSRAVEEVRDDQ